MASPASRAASALPENQGHQRENGTERTSATAVTPASLSSATKRSAVRLEWPMVKRSQAADRVIGSVEFSRSRSPRRREIGRRPGRRCERQRQPRVSLYGGTTSDSRRTGFDRRARAGGCQLEDAMGRLAGGAGLAVLLSLLSWAGHARADVMVRIDKSSQRMSVMVNGEHRYTWPVSTGIYGTPSGTFRPQSLARYHRSTLYNNAPMPYSIFYDGNFARTSRSSADRRPAAASGCIPPMPPFCSPWCSNKGWATPEFRSTKP